MLYSSQFKIETNPQGISLWLDGLWILDASCFLEDGEIEINTKNFNIKRDDYNHKMVLKIKGFKQQ